MISKITKWLFHYGDFVNFIHSDSFERYFRGHTTWNLEKNTQKRITDNTIRNTDENKKKKTKGSGH